jgi:hypothetical protein
MLILICSLERPDDGCIELKHVALNVIFKIKGMLCLTEICTLCDTVVWVAFGVPKDCTTIINALFWVTTKRVVVISYQRFGTYRSPLRGGGIHKGLTLDKTFYNILFKYEEVGAPVD